MDIISTLITLIIGFVSGVLVMRNNTDKINKVVAKVKPTKTKAKPAAKPASSAKPRRRRGRKPKQQKD